MSYISVKNLSKSFIVKGEKKTITILDYINLEIKPGNIIGLTGENGAGKTTLLKIIAGILRPTSGEVKTEGKVMGLFDIPLMLDPNLSVKESVYLLSAFAGVNQKEVNQNYDAIIKFAGLEKFKNGSPGQFSTGMIARLVISTGLYAEPQIMLLDESLASIDTKFKQKAMNRVKEIIAQGGIAILASHDEEIIKNNTTSSILLKNGHIL